MLCRGKVFITSNTLSKHSPLLFLEVSGITNPLQIFTNSKTPHLKIIKTLRYLKHDLKAVGWSSLVYSIKTTPTHLVSLHYANKYGICVTVTP
jgi:hypothetical protein